MKAKDLPAVGSTIYIPCVVREVDPDDMLKVLVLPVGGDEDNGDDAWLQDSILKHAVTEPPTITPGNAPCVLTYREGRYPRLSEGTYDKCIEIAKGLIASKPKTVVTISRVLGTVSLEAVVKEVPREATK